MAIRNRFLTASPQAVQFDWIDWTSGFGYRRLYGCVWIDYDGGSHTRDYILTPSISEGNTGSSDAANRHIGYYTQGAVGADLDIDFDITIDKQTVLGGSDAFINVPHYNSDANGTNLITVDIIHYDGSSETSLGTADSDYMKGNHGFKDFIIVAMTEKTFKKGDILRLTVTVTNNVSGYSRLYHDPANRKTLNDFNAETDVPTDLTFDVPVKVYL